MAKSCFRNFWQKLLHCLTKIKHAFLIWFYQSYIFPTVWCWGMINDQSNWCQSKTQMETQIRINNALFCLDHHNSITVMYQITREKNMNNTVSHNKKMTNDFLTVKHLFGWTLNFMQLALMLCIKDNVSLMHRNSFW